MTAKIKAPFGVFPAPPPALRAGLCGAIGKSLSCEDRQSLSHFFGSKARVHGVGNPIIRIFHRMRQWLKTRFAGHGMLVRKKLFLGGCVSAVLACAGAASADEVSLFGSELTPYEFQSPPGVSDWSTEAPREFSGEEAARSEVGEANPTTEMPTIGKLVSLESAPAQEKLFRSWDLGEELEFVSPEVWDETMGHRNRVLRLPRLRSMSHEPYTDYRRNESVFSYLPGSGDDLGWIDFKSDHYREGGYGSGFSTGIGIHLLSGPRVVDAPPRLYTMTLGYQKRNFLGDAFSYDVAAAIGIYSDFEGSVREGIRFPGHAVGIFHRSPESDWVLGFDFLDRDDRSVLPVFGISYHSERYANMRFDLVFPRPQVEYAMNSGRIVYVAGRLGGDSWDMEFPSGRGDVLTYSERQLLLGTRAHGGRTGSAVEVGYAFRRKIQFEDFSGRVEPGGAFVFRLVSTN